MLLQPKQINKPFIANVGVGGFNTSAANSDNVTTALTTALSSASGSGGSVPLQPGSYVTATGVLTQGIPAAPNNHCSVFLSGVAKNRVVDASGEEVYAKLTNAGAVWTLSYFSAPGGVETPFAFTAATAIDFEVPYWFSFDNLPSTAFVAVAQRHVSPDVGASTRIQTDMLVPTAMNVIPDLSQTPTGTMTNFFVNGQMIVSGANTGINNTGKTVTVTATLLGYNIATTDEVYAQYAY